MATSRCSPFPSNGHISNPQNSTVATAGSPLLKTRRVSISPHTLPLLLSLSSLHSLSARSTNSLSRPSFQPNSEMGLSVMNSPPPGTASMSHYHTHKVFLLCNYVLLGAASSCIFLTLSLRLVPSVSGFFLILLHVLTIAGAIAGCAAAAAGRGSRWYGAHMVATVLTAIFQGSVAVLIFTRTGNFLGYLKSYVREEDGAVILKLAGGLCVVIFCLEWVVLTLAFFLKYYAYVEGSEGGVVRRSAKVQQDEDLKDWPWPFQV